MKKLVTLFVAASICIPALMDAQLRVTTDGQVQLDAGSGKANEATTVTMQSSESDLWKSSLSVLNLVNSNKTAKIFCG